MSYSRLRLSCLWPLPPRISFIFFFHAPAPTELYTLSLHDALPISARRPWIIPSSWATATALRSPFSTRDRRARDRKSTRLNSSHRCISYAVFCLKKKKKRKSEEDRAEDKGRDK